MDLLIVRSSDPQIVSAVVSSGSVVAAVILQIRSWSIQIEKPKFSSRAGSHRIIDLLKQFFGRRQGTELVKIFS